MIREVETGKIYKSGHGIRFKVLDKMVHYGLDCSNIMVYYKNLDETGHPVGTRWILEESLFIKKI